MTKKLILTTFSKTAFFIGFITLIHNVQAQGYLHANGKYIYDGLGNEVILRGIGTGNWMIQEGYMMQTSGVAGTQHEFRAKLTETIGETFTDSFYTVWLDNHLRKVDIDSMKAWGFNSIRPALHYYWFTPPIEDEPVSGEITWKNKGFELLDSLISWCSANEMYVILDMHGTPGGQGTDQAISDYDPTKPSLWQSDLNKAKLVALWRKIADRCATEPWVGGYDLINETNWTFTEANNAPLWNLHKEITSAIREVDTNHMVIIEGNWFANDFTGLPALWDDNMALSFHKYWTYNTQSSIEWMVNLRNSRNCPIWLGESGENSNTWFTEMVTLAEKNHIGWSWWPVKKSGINNVLRSETNSDYTRLINYWKGSATNPGAEAAFQAVLTFALNHKFENCHIQYDVIDALLRQPADRTPKPFTQHIIGEPIFTVNYDLGPNTIAYSDADTANYNLSTDTYVNWNQGWSFRNDGVDIESCNDALANNGYNVGWTNAGEWLLYTVQIPAQAAYTFDVRHASGSSGGTIHMEVDGVDVTGPVKTTGTGGWAVWQTKTLENIILPEGEHKIKLVIDKAGCNLNYFKFYNPVDVSNADFVYLSSQTYNNGWQVALTLNKEITTENISASEFTVKVGSDIVGITGATVLASDKRMLLLTLDQKIYFNKTSYVSYTGTSVVSDTQQLAAFTSQLVTNTLPKRQLIPGKIQAENFYYNYGLVLEDCSDTGGGQNTGYAANGDYLDYLVLVNATGNYTFNFRVACTSASRKLTVKLVDDENITDLGTITFTSTGGWQTWKTQSINIPLTEGEHKLRLYVTLGEFNLNWFDVQLATGVEDETNGNSEVFIYPNPVINSLTISSLSTLWNNSEIIVYSITGQQVLNATMVQSEALLPVSQLRSGFYLVAIKNNGQRILKTFIKE